MKTLTIQDYDFNDNGRIAAARHCDRLRAYVKVLEGCTGLEAVEVAQDALHENQASVAAYAGLSRSRLSELKTKKRPTKADQNALITAFVRRWIV